MNLINPIKFDWKYGSFFRSKLHKEQFDNNYKMLEDWSLKIEKWLVFNSCLNILLMLAIITIIFLK